MAQPIFRRMAPHAAFACVLALAACSDGPSAGLVDPIVRAPVPGEAVEALLCEADARAKTVVCRPYEGAGAGGASRVRTLGGQNVNVRVASSNVQFDSAANIFSMDVTVQNLLVQKMGTADGSTVSGVSVFFHSGPNVTGGTLGSAEVRNPDGYGIFTSGAPQPYFHWNEVLPLNATSASRRWEFDTSGPDVRFQFIVYIRTELLPVVLFDRNVSGNRDIYRVALDGSDLVRLTTATGDDVNPTVGGSLVVFTSFRSGNAELWSMPLAGGTQTRLTTTGAAETDPALSPDGTRLAYVTNAQFGTGKVWTAAPVAGLTGAARATPAGFGLDGAPELGPAWAPTGSRLALVSTGAGSPDVFDFTMPGTPTLLSGHPDYSEVDPAWSLDGTRLVYVSTATGDGDLYLFDTRTGQTTRLTTRAGADAAPTWLRDGRIVYQAW
ncbi:MAG TPA: hypothetical protein VF142_08635, partial [Longimicrobium sp.]